MVFSLLKRARQHLRRWWRRRSVFLGARTASRLARLEEKFETNQREMRLVLSSMSLPDRRSLDIPAGFKGEGPRAGALSMSSACRQDFFEEPHFSYWARRLGARPIYHRKLWALVYIVQAFWERDVLRPGSRGLGFGVGREALSALFASHGCEIVGTDLAQERAGEAGWIKSAQHAAGLDNLRRPDICDEETFARNVSFQVCDMNAIPDTLVGFDFCWSACAFEHLGSIDLGLRFVENSLAVLKPGGWAIHTTELNLSSNIDTIDNQTTVLFRRGDFGALATRLKSLGHRVAPFDFEIGDRPMERFIDVPPYRNEPHLVLALEGHATTSFGLIVQKAA